MPRSSEQEWREQLCHSTLSSSARHVGHVLALSMNADGSGARIGNQALADRAGLAYKTVAASLKELKEEKWLLLAAPAAGRRPASWLAHIPGDIWDEIALDRPEEIMKRDRYTKPRSSVTTTEQDPVARHSLPNKGEEDESYPQETRSSVTTTEQDAFARTLLGRSSVVVTDNLDLDLRKEPPTPYSSEPPPGGENRSAPGYRDPTLWAQADEITKRAPRENPAAYRVAVYNRLNDEARNAERASRHQAAIDNCTECTSTGHIETDDGWIRHNHGE